MHWWLFSTIIVLAYGAGEKWTRFPVQTKLQFHGIVACAVGGTERIGPDCKAILMEWDPLSVPDKMPTVNVTKSGFLMKVDNSHRDPPHVVDGNLELYLEFVDCCGEAYHKSGDLKNNTLMTYTINYGIAWVEGHEGYRG